MPGSSLWLIPPPSSPLHTPLTKLITTSVPQKHLPSSSPPPPPFAPHITLTSNIPPSLYESTGAQAWLDSIPFPTGKDVKVLFECVRSEEVFFRRCYIAMQKEGVRSVGKVARREGVLGGDEGKAEAWVEGEYGPHLSLLYSDVSLSEEVVAEVEKSVEAAGVILRGEGGEMGGWTGGVVWLVPTDRPIDEWKPIALREL